MFEWKKKRMIELNEEIERKSNELINKTQNVKSSP